MTIPIKAAVYGAVKGGSLFWSVESFSLFSSCEMQFDSY